MRKGHVIFGMVEHLVSKDLPIFFDLLKEFQATVEDVTKLIKGVETRILNGTLDTKKGISLLDVKYHLLLGYLIDLSQYILLKTEGKSIHGSVPITGLVETRVVLEKLRPLEQKLKYQIDKLVRLAASGDAGGSNNPLRFKPNPDNLVSKLPVACGDESKDKDDDETEKDPVGVYVPPRVTAVPFEENSRQTKQQKKEERMKKRALSSAMLKELRDEFSEAPEEISFQDFGGGQKRKRELDKETERLRYEEDNLIRLSGKSNAKQARTAEQELDDLTQFDDLSVLTEGTKGGKKQKRTLSSHTKSKRRGRLRRKGFRRKKS